MKNNIDKETGFSIPLAKEFEIFDLFKLKNRTAIITGSANGIGRIAAVALGKAGANIAITDIDFPAAKELEEELSLEGIKCKSYLMDAAKENNIKETFSKIDKDLGDVDILVNNAGAAHRSASEDMTTENLENIIKLNLTGSFICAKTAAKRMLKNKKGCIINIASIINQLESFQEIDEINYQGTIISRIEYYYQLFVKLMTSILILAFFISIFTISNTIRLTIYAKEKLIESLQLIGATRFFVKAPYIIEGVLLGFIGSILSCALLIGALEFSNDLIYSFLSFEIYYDMNLLILILCSISVLITFIGSSRAITKFLK